MLSFFPRGVLDEILNLIESVSEGFYSYSFLYHCPCELYRVKKMAEELRKLKQQSLRLYSLIGMSFVHKQTILKGLYEEQIFKLFF